MTVSEQLREAIRQYDSVNALAADSGVSQSSLQRFVTEERDLRLETVDRLCQYLRLELTPTARTETRRN
jgi:DNA-binding Xre family transcriptional regulator